jgi:type I restriction enzyme S subunit
MAGSWKRVPLAQIAEFTSKPGELRLTNYKAIPFVPMELIPSDKIAIDGFLMKDPSAISSGTFFKEGDILLPKITPSFENGKQAIAEDLPLPFGIATTEVIPLREKVNISDKLFLFYFLLKGDIRQNLASRMEGTTGRQRLNTEALKTLPVLLPPLPEQRAIARVLRAVQEVMQALRRELELERERKAALMHHLFRYGTRGEPTRQTEIGEIPQSWEVVTINDIKASPTGALVAGPFGSNIGKRFFVETGIPVIRGNNLTTGEKFFIDDGFVFITEQKAEELKYCEALPDDIIITAAGTLGQVGIIPKSSKYPRYIISNKQIRLRVRQDRVNPIYVFYWLSNNKIKDIIQTSNSGSSIPVINLTVVKSLPIPIPTIEEQNDIIRLMECCQETITTLEQELALYQELFRALLEELMSGRLSAQPLLEQEPA